MHKLSRDTDLTCLLGAELVQVCIGTNEVILNFDRGVRITILSDFALGEPNGPTVRYLPSGQPHQRI